MEDTVDRSFETEREKIEERHRNEILNLLKSFEFEKKDIEARFRQELESKENERERLDEKVETEELQNFSQSDVLVRQEEWQKEQDEQKVEFEKEKEELLLRISELEGRLQKGDITEDGCPSAITESEAEVSFENHAKSDLEGETVNQSYNNQDEMNNSEQNTADMKSLSELEKENKQLKIDLDKRKDQILQLKNQLENLTKKLQDIEKLFEDGDIPSDKRDALSQILSGSTSNVRLSDDVLQSPSNSPSAHEKSFDDIDTTLSGDKLNRTNSVLSFQLQELNFENEDLKRSFCELEQKLRKTVEENEIRVNVFNERLTQLAEKIMPGEYSETTQESGFKMNLVEEINNIRLEKTSNELLEEYVSIVLGQKLTASSPDIPDVNFCHALQSLEQILDSEIFDGRVFDTEMKDEVKQVLRDKERELLVAYTLDKLRDEIRHRATTEGTLEELQKEREKDFCVHQAVNEILKGHLGISDNGAGHDTDSQGIGRTLDSDKQAVNKVLMQHFGIENEDDKVMHSDLSEVNGEEGIENRSASTDVESLKAEKENLEKNLQELQDYFEKERQAWLEKLRSPLQEDSNDPEDKDKVIQTLHAQKVLMEQILNTERFHLSRLYYMEMKEELETCLKQHQFDRNTKLEKERLVDAWKHHAEVGDLYQEILSKESENLQNLQADIQEENEPGNDGENDGQRNELNRERSRLEQQLPVKLELLELQRKRCRDHKAASLVLEQAVAALETAVQEQETLLFSGNYIQRKSSWSSIEEGEEMESSDMKKEFSQELREETDDKSVPSPNISSELVGTSSKKDVLADELVRLFEKLLSGEQERNGKQLDSCTSDSELSEVETLSGQDPPSDDEGPIKKDNSEEKDASSTNTSPRPTGQKTTGELEDKPEDKVDPSVPVIFKLPPRIENVLNIERFNMSRLLRDEYVDRIRRGREKLRRAKAKKEEKNGELASKFQEEVKALLEGVEFGESGEEERTLPQQRRRLTATPSYDSGIVDPAEQDKDEVVKKYKELLEKARRDLNRAHRALKARSSGGQEMKDEIAVMKRSAKEAKNDLDELEEKRNDLDVERDRLLGKVKDLKASTSFDDEGKMSDSGDISMLEREDEMPLEGDPSEGVFANQVSTDENNIAERSGERSPGKSETVEKDLERKMKDMENKIEKLREEKMSAEEEVKELQSKLVAGTGGEEILKDLQEKVTAANDQKSKLEDKCSELEREVLMKDDTFGAEIKKKEAEVNELQKKLVSGSGEEDILKELQEKLDSVREEKLAIEEKCVGLEEKVNEKEEKLKSIENEMDALERKSVEGTGAEEIVAKLQEKLTNAKVENAKEEEKCHELEKDVQEKNKALKDIKESHEKEVDELQKQLVAGTGGEKVLEDLKEQLRVETKQNGSLEEKNSELEKEMKRKGAVFSDKEKKLEDEKNELQRKLVEGTGGEEILTELQEKLKEAKKQNNSLEKSNSDLEKQIERKEKTFSEDIKKLEDEINDLQDKLVSGTGGEEILHDLQDKLNEAEKKNKCFEKKNSDLEKEIENKEKKMKDEINDLQRKLVAGSGGEEILEGLQEKLRQEKDEKNTLQRKCEELEDKAKAKAKDEELGDEIKQKDNEINELQKKLMSAIGGDEILAELQDRLEHEKDKKVSLQTRCEELEDQRKAKDKEFSDEIKEKDNEINELQKKIVSGTGAEDILAELQDELEKAKQDKAVLQTQCEEQEDKLKTKDREFNDEIKQKDHEISEMQKKLVCGTGGEEILAELQDKLLKEKDDKVALQTRCQELENQKQEKDTDFSNEIKEKDNEINELQKNLVCGTGGEEILAELQDKLVKANEEKVALQTQCDELKEKKKEKDKELGDEIKEKDYEINELQKKLVSGTGGEEILTDLQDKLEKAKEEISVLQTKCRDIEDKKREKNKEFSDEIKTKDNEIGELQKKLVSGTGGEEILAELQDKLEKSKEEKAVLQAQFDQQQDKLKTNDKNFNDKIGEKDSEINELQKKLVTGTGGEEILAELQDKLVNEKDEKVALQTRCEDLEEEIALKDTELRNQKKENAQKVNDLQTKLIAGTGSEEVLAELQNKLKKAEESKEMLAEKCSNLDEKIKKKDLEAKNEKIRKDEEIDKLQRRLLSGTAGEEILEELKVNLKEAEEEKGKLERTCTELEEDLETKEKELQGKDEEVIDLQKNIIDGSGGEELLKKLQENLKDAKESEKILEKRCSGLEKDLQEKERKLTDESKCKQNEIEDLQRKLVNGSGGEEVLLDLQDKLNQSDKDKVMLGSKVAELQKDMEGMRDKFADKQEEVNKLQRNLVEGTEAEDILVDLQEKLATARNSNKKLETKCRELEKQRNLDGDNEKELKNLKAANKVLENENRAKQEKINELQLKMLEGRGGEDVLKELQNELNAANERNEELVIRNKELEEERSEDLENNTAALMEENGQLEEDNEAMVAKLENLQRSVVNGTGSEELLQELQDEIKKVSSENQDLRKISRGKESISREGKDSLQLEKELKKVNQEKRRLIADHERKENEIADLQKKLVAGSGGEELLADLQKDVKRLKDENKKMAVQFDDLEETKKDLTNEINEKKKLERSLLKENEKLLEQNESKDNEIRKLQKSIAEGSGADELVKMLQDKVKETAYNNRMLEKKCSDLECDAVELLDDKDLLKQKAIDLDEAEKKIERLAQDCEEKDQEIVELQRKLVAATGGEEVLEDLQNQVKNLQELNKDLEKKLSKSRKDRTAQDSLEKRGKKFDKKTPNNLGPQKTDDKSTGNRFTTKVEGKDASYADNADEYPDEDIIDEPITYEQCLQKISETNEEKDFWKEKYEALKRKVGEQFVDTIPDVWKEETELEKQREEILSQLSDLRQEISERETPVIKTASEKERIETELSKVENDLEVCSENLEQFRDMQNEEILIGRNEEKLAQCLHELELKTESLPEKYNEGVEDSTALMIPDDDDTDGLERKFEQLYSEAAVLLAEEQDLRGSQDKEKDIAVEKIDTENEIQQMEAAIQKLQQGLARESDSSSRNLEGLKDQHSKIEDLTNELAKVQHEINELQSSLEAPSSSGGQEVNNLLALMKEKSKLEDELTDTEKSVNQLGKREYEALVKERKRHEKVAKTLLELSREKEATEEELQGIEALVQEKESELLKSFNAELKDKEALDTPKKKGRRFRKRKSSFEVKSEEPGAASSAEEGFSDIDLGEPPLSSDATLALSEELGSLIQKKSSLAVRVEDLGKKITAQSLKVEKSLLGVKGDDASGDQPLGESFVSAEDLTQSQMSIFDDYNMVDELSLATSIVGDERVKRKSSRKGPMSKLLKEKSALEKKLKESQGKVLVQNTKVKNTLKEDKDAGKAKEKFVQAVQDRKAVEDELSNVGRKIDELASEEGSVKGKKAKTPKKGKSLSKNDKRRLLSQRESLGKQLDAIKKKIENFSLDGEDAGLADFPEMRETGSIGNTVERLRELIAREAKLKQEVNRLTAKEDTDSVSSRLGGRKTPGEMLKRGKVGRRGDRKRDVEGSSMTSEFSGNTSEFSGITSEGSGVTSEASGMTSDSSVTDEGTGVILDTDEELVKSHDKDGLVKDTVDTSHADQLNRDLGNQVKGLSSGDEDYQSDDEVTKRETEVKTGENIHDRGVSLGEVDSKVEKSTSGSLQLPDSKDTKESSIHGDKVPTGSPSYPEVIDLLVKEKARKAARLRDIEKEIENQESSADKTQDADLLLQMKRENLQHKIQFALNELQQRKEALEESKNLSRETTTDEDPEKILERDHFALTKQKDELGAELAAIKDEMDKQARRGEDLEGISTDYQAYKDVKEKEKYLVEELDEINEKLHKRKEWSALDSPREEVNNELAETYADILKRMSDENLNMADLIHELEETKATLSKEREITSELLDLIKSRVGNELLEALMGQGLQSPSVEIREMGMFEGEGYQELVDKVENEIVTVAEVIDEYKKINQFLFGENQKLHKTMELLKAKVDEDLFATIVDQESVDVEISKKNEISEILANNKTLFEQISSASEHKKLARSMEDKIQNLKRELEGVRKRDEKDKMMKEKVEDISKELGEAKKRREELKRKLKNLERGVGFSNKAFDKSGEEHRYSQAETDSQLKEFNESQNQDDSTKEMDGSIADKQKLKEMGAPKDLTEEDGESGQIDRDEVLQEIKSRLEEAAELGNRADAELEILNKKLAGTETEISGSGIRRVEARKGSDGRSELKYNDNHDLGSGDSGKHKQDDGQICEDNRGYAEENIDEEWNENISSVQNLERAFIAKLDEVQDLQENLKKHLDKKELEYVAQQDGIQPENNVLREELEKNKSALHNLKKEHEALRSEALEKVEDINEGLRNDLELSKETFDENEGLKVTRQSMENEMEETTAKLGETCKERDEIKREFENLQKENKSVEERLILAENENIELKEKIAASQNDNEELTNNLNECQKTVNQAKEMLSTLEEANAVMKEKIDKFQHENKGLKTKLTEADEMKTETEKVVEDLEAKTTSLQEKIATLENEKLDTNDVIRALKNENEEGIVKLNEINETLKDNEEKFKTLQDLDGKNESLKKALNVLEKENKELNDKIIGLQNENDQVTAKLNEAREMIKDNEELVKTLQGLATENKSLKEALDSLQIENKKMNDKTQENESIKDTLALLENENNEIIPRVEELEKLKKELEDEVDYLRKGDKDFQSLNEKLKNAEVKQGNMEKELEVLKKESKEIEDFVREDLNQDTGNGVKSALETFKEMCENNDAENKALKEEARKLTKLQNIVGDNLSKKLIDLSKEGLVLDDSEDNPKCLESLINDNKSLASILNQYESELAKVEQHLGDDLLSIVTNKDSELDEEESENPLKIVDELKNGKNLKEIIKEYEDLINSQADNDQNVQYLQEKVDMLESKLEALKNIRDNVLVEDDVAGRVMANVEDQNESDIANAGKYGDVRRSEAALLQAAEFGDENLKPSEEYKDDTLMDTEYQDLLKKVIDHQAEIEEAEQLLQTQRAKHEADKQNMMKQFNTEKTNMQQLINNERSSMEKAMQNLINEIVRLKEERNEIRKNNRIEKEKLVLAFDNERAELLSRNEERKNEVEVNLEKKFQDDLEKVTKEMEAREAKLKEELVKLKTERNDLASKVVEMEDKIGSEMIGSEGNEKTSLSKERKSKEQIKNEFEEKMNVEKERFQETLNSLRQEIERLQKERSRAINEISRKQEDITKQSTDVSSNEAVIYDRLESEFKAKMNTEKTLMESRIKELRKENEVLNQQKQELKSSMRIERLELSKKYEKEKEELAEKYRNELKTLRKNIEKTQTIHEPSTVSTQNFYELRRKIRDRDTKIKRYETFFKELNQEASILQRDSDMAT